MALVVIAVSVGKAAILAAIVRLFGYTNVIPLATGLTLFQVGEFALVLSREGLALDAIPSDVHNLTLNVAVVSMGPTPIVSGLVPMIYARLWSQRHRDRYEMANFPDKGLSTHIVIAGGGRVGRTIATALQRASVQTVLIEFDDRHSRLAREAGLAVIYGDAMQPIVLLGCGPRPRPRDSDYATDIYRRPAHRGRSPARAPRSADHGPGR